MTALPATPDGGPREPRGRQPRWRHRTGLLAVSVLAVGALAACGSSSHPSAAPTTTHSTAPAPASATPRALVGTFEITAGACTSATATPTGSWLGMLGAGGAGFIKNPGGGCANADYTVLRPGVNGGLITGSYQPNPTPAFTASGGARADGIVMPATFYGSGFAMSTDPVDPQTHLHVPAPSVTDTAGRLTGNFEAVSVAYNSAYFNQGAPKPGGTYPGLTRAVSGTISCSGAYSLTWQSLIVGGAFNGFTGRWHLTGTFRPASGTLAAALGCS